MPKTYWIQFSQGCKTKEFSYMILLSFSLAVLTLSYILTTGVDQTQARNYYNQAMLMIQRNDYQGAEQKLLQAKGLASSTEIEKKLNEVRNHQN